MSEEYNSFMNELVCPICGQEIKYTGDSDFNSAGEIYYEGECSNEKCSTSFRVYEENGGYDLWYDIPIYTYSLNEDTNELTIYEDGFVLATVSDVSSDGAEDMFTTVVYEMRNINLESEV